MLALSVFGCRVVWFSFMCRAVLMWPVHQILELEQQIVFYGVKGINCEFLKKLKTLSRDVSGGIELQMLRAVRVFTIR